MAPVSNKVLSMAVVLVVAMAVLPPPAPVHGKQDATCFQMKGCTANLCLSVCTSNNLGTVATCFNTPPDMALNNCCCEF
ncbi:hypothetical protein SETIT_6G056000v2 [Setaria italica]|uniref:Hydrophobic seed protein domain-containing protein n=1 Tax=Setaria italica TaxID=4555 RepID=A0A368RII5_SETIT|nr:hypothetical protein SETIT_6G056000v2 [Setaria italica]